jgi:hypothetical protein
MARTTLDDVESEDDFALGMGVAIGMFIALFAIAIVLFVIEQGRNTAPTGTKSAHDTTRAVASGDAPAGSTARQ